MKNKSRTTFLTVYGKFLLLGFIIFLWFFTASIRVHANESDSEPAAMDTSSTTVYTVVGIEHSERLSNLAPFEMVRRSIQNTEPLFYHVYNNSLLNVNAIIEDSEGTITTKTLTVSWSCWDDSTTVTNTTVCGEYIETGTILLPDDSYTWGEGVMSELTLLVRVYDPSEPVEIVALEEVRNEFDIAFSLEQNSSIEDFLITAPLQTAWPCYDATGNEYLCPVIYNTEDVMEDTVGIYYITVTFEEPLNCRFSDNLIVPSYSIPVTVQAPGHPRLDLSYISPNYDFIIFPWITSGIDLDTMEVWMSENNGEWRILELDWEAYIYDTMLNLYAFLLNEGSSYQIQVKYEGGQTGVASFTYEGDKLSNKEYLEGDRDGGDTDGNPPSDSTDSENTNNTPPTDSGNNGNTNNTVSAPEKKEPVTIEDNTPKVDSSNEQDSSEIIREVTSIPSNDSEPETETTEPAATDREEPYLLGSEIDHMIQNTGTARFSEETIMLNIPEDTIASLDISETDRLLVTILPLENNGFSIDILKNDVSVTNVSGMQVSLPYQPPANTTPVLMNEADIKVADGDYNPDTGLVTFSINETGTFYIQDEEVPMQDTFSANTLTVTEISAPEENTDNSAFKLIALVATVIITCSVGITIFIYTKKRRT